MTKIGRQQPNKFKLMIAIILILSSLTTQTYHDWHTWGCRSRASWQLWVNDSHHGLWVLTVLSSFCLKNNHISYGARHPTNTYTPTKTKSPCPTTGYFENTFFAQEGVKFHHLGARYVCTVVIILILVAQFLNFRGSTLLGEAEQMPWSAIFWCVWSLTLFIVASFHELPWFDFSCLPTSLAHEENFGGNHKYLLSPAIPPGIQRRSFLWCDELCT